MGAESKGSYGNYSILGKTATWVPEFAVEDLTSAELHPKFLRLQWSTALGENTQMYLYTVYIKLNRFFKEENLFN